MSGSIFARREFYQSRRVDYLGGNSFGSVAMTFSGQNAFGTFTSGNSAWLTQMQDASKNKFVIVSFAMIAGADTVIGPVSINGLPAIVDVQANTGGYIAGIASIINTYTLPERAVRFVATLTGTVATAGILTAAIGTGFIRSRPIAVASSTTAVDTVRNVTLPAYVNGLVVCVGINDVGAANQCTWTGTNNPAEDFDAAVGAARASSAARGPVSAITENQSYSITSTWDVSSANGVSLAVASYR